MLTIGVFTTSAKENEHRVPIHPTHISQIPETIRKNLFFECGYGLHFGIQDEEIKPLVGGMLSREELFASVDIALLPKPVLSDFQHLKKDGILWGWPHFVQNTEVTDIAIEKQLSVIAWENMFKDGIHIFKKNNELAGYAGVLDALRLKGLDGIYGQYNPAISVISYGSVSKGAVNALLGRGFKNITVFTKRNPQEVTEKVSGVEYAQMIVKSSGEIYSQRKGQKEQPFLSELIQSEIIFNGILQDTDHPLTFISQSEIEQLKPGTLIIDISCDTEMGFAGARPTSFESPIFKMGNNVTYYAVDHTPTYLYDAASREISLSILPYLEPVMLGPSAWEENDVIREAVDIQKGKIRFNKIISYQHREKEYPYTKIISDTSVELQKASPQPCRFFSSQEGKEAGLETGCPHDKIPEFSPPSR